ncbi:MULTISPECIES: AbgT family transporter [unclassified Corynebacterium]|uniref:AbgT family transporter n=1 Tax=unclassified Corynebacterium TaxID=2624378 RepID=UPI0029CA883E|nr:MULTISPECIES: AbgT family transporter [unclassified Corynebacterium]WPF66200.1 AbgT family transporter [Corynebacterium sp. 22KM0430]WPF68691.1 AbgT family transporter [Corynebacterium sp. 21KM1197]
MSTETTAEPRSTLGKWGDRFLGTIEAVGNKLPTPFLLFLILFFITAVASSLMAWSGASVQVPGSGETLSIKGLFTGEGLVWFTENIGENYIGFPPLVTVLPIMLAVGIAERSGMLAALIRKLFGSANKTVLPYAVGVTGVTASVMADAAFVVVPPLAAMVFKAAGRHPVAGLLGGFAAVGAGYSTSLVPSSLDALFAGITNAVMEGLPGLGAQEVNPVSNYYFNIASAILLGLIAGFLIDRVLEPRMTRQQVPTEQQAIDEDDTQAAGQEDLSAELEPKEWLALKVSLWATLLATALVLVAVLLPGSPWRNEEGGFLPQSPLLNSIVFLVMVFFLVMGITYGVVVGSIHSVDDAVAMMTESLKGMLEFLVLAFILGQFVALFNWTGIGTWTAVKGAAGLEAVGLTGFAAVLAFIILASCLNLLIISGSAMWTLMAAVFVPMFALLGYEPGFVQAAFRVGDSATQIITPLNPYMIVILGMLRRYEPQAGLGTLMSRMFVFVIPFGLTWVLLLALWFYADLPLGPGAEIFLG